MASTHRFFRCKHCGNMVGLIHDGGAPMVCCGEPMAELVPNTVDAVQEKHVPVIEVNGASVTVKVGSVAHPMLEEHHIEWIFLATEKGGQRKPLAVPGEPSAIFVLTPDDKVVAAYAYCNLHGLWKADA